MTSTNYSKAVQSAANRFLSDYHLTLEQLTEAQQKHVFHYIRINKWWLWILLIFLFGIIVSGYGALGEYLKIQKFIGEAVILSASGTEIDWQKICSFSFEQGFLIGIYAFNVVYFIMLTILVPININGQKRTLDAFLPALAPKSMNESHKQD
jgi:hypothetical protein